MTSIKINLILLFILMGINGLSAQNYVPITDVNELKEYDQLLVEKYPSFFDKKTVVDVYKIDDNYNRIVYKDNGELTEELVYKQELTKVIVAKSILIPEDNVPNIIKDAFKKSVASKYNADRYYEVSPSFGGPGMYAIEYEEDGATQRVYFSKLGRKENPPR